MSPRSKRWKQTEEQIGEKWNKIFQEKAKELKEKWSVHYQDVVMPEQTDEWEEPLMEPLMITFKCRECPNHVWTTQGMVNLYFRRNQPIENDCGVEPNGEIFIWLQSEPCPNCSNIVRPLMSVKQNEMDAVLSYLKMEIGWYYYKIEYTKDEEKQIEESRNKKKTTRRKANISETDLHSINKVIASEPPAVESLANNSLKVVGHVKPNAPAANVKSNANNQIKKLDKQKKTPQVVKTRKDFHTMFYGLFGNFLTENEQNDRWTFKLDEVTQNHDILKNNRWHWFLGEKANVFFNCLVCGKTWDTMRGWVAFWIWQNHKGPDGKLQGGKVTIDILKQKCTNESTRCPRETKSYGNVEVFLEGEEIEALLSNLYIEVDYWFYENEGHTESELEKINKKRKIHSRPRWAPGGKGHQIESCMACRLKVCNKKVIGDWEGGDQLADVATFHEAKGHQIGEKRDDLRPVFTKPSVQRIM